MYWAYQPGVAGRAGEDPVWSAVRQPGVLRLTVVENRVGSVDRVLGVDVAAVGSFAVPL